jgi:hypothetical protein
MFRICSSNKQAKLNWLHDRSQIDACNLKGVRCEEYEEEIIES